MRTPQLAHKEISG